MRLSRADEPIILASADARREFFFARVNHCDDVHERMCVRHYDMYRRGWFKAPLYMLHIGL